MPQENNKAFHLSLKVRDLDRSVEFYGRLFGVPPAKRFADYAKFEVEDPAVVLSLEPAVEGDRIGLDHLGVRLPSRNHLVDATSRISERGLAFEHIAGVECCYSRQSKIYMNDPDGHLFEVYTVDADLADSRAARGSATSEVKCEARDGKFEHNLPLPFPAMIAAQDHSLDEISLRGTFNAAISPDEAWRIVKECRRTLKAGGKISTHILVADRAVQGDIPRLPEPASHVRRVPTEDEMRVLFEEAGFVGIELKRFSHASVFGFGGAEFREYLLVASVAHASVSGPDQLAVYKGPFPSVTDELGNTYLRGQRTVVSAAALSRLKTSGYQEHFVLLVTGGGC